jgi:hypothetical protein
MYHWRKFTGSAVRARTLNNETTNEGIRKMKKSKFTEPNQKAPTNQTSVVLPTQEQIRQRAHEIFLARGGGPGNALEDWLIAEKELKEKCTRTGKPA